MITQNHQNDAKPLLLLGTSRSGTTLFQRILNSYDDVMLWGEHSGYLTNLVESYFELVDSPSMEKYSYPQSKGQLIEIDQYKNPKQWQAWNNWFHKNDVDELYRNLIRKTFSGSWERKLTYWGFKEVRYGGDDKVIDFFIRLFPDTQVVIVCRNPMNVIESQLSSFANIGGRLEKIRKIFLLPKIIKMAKKWKKRNLNYLAYAQKYPKSVTFISFESYISDMNVLQGVMDKLSLPFTDHQKEVLNLREGRGSAFSSDKSKKESTNNRWKKLGFIPALCIWLCTWSAYKKISKSINKGLNVEHE